jgi:AraC-like DNA-binding protein
MPLWALRPDPRLARFVEAIHVSTDEGEPLPPATFRVVPDGNVDLLFSWEAADGEPGPDRPCEARVFGTKRRALLVRDARPTEKLAVGFRPGAAHHFLGGAVGELADGALDLAALWGERARELARDVADAPDRTARKRAVERALLCRLERAHRERGADALVDAAVRLALASRGRATVRTLCRETGAGERRLERLFRARIGVGPKRLLRIVRFRAAYEALRAGGAQAGVALASGYADQAHMLREFRALAGAPPSRCFARGGA